MRGTRVEVFLHGVMREYLVEQPLDVIKGIWEMEDELVIAYDRKRIYVQRSQCPVVEMSEYDYGSEEVTE